MAIINVGSGGDVGAGTLRDALSSAASGDTIIFTVPMVTFNIR